MILKRDLKKKWFKCVNDFLYNRTMSKAIVSFILSKVKTVNLNRLSDCLMNSLGTVDTGIQNHALTYW